MINSVKNFIYNYLIKSIFYILAKLLIFIFSKFLNKNKVNSFLFRASYNLIFKSVSYYKNLRSDLEALYQLSNLRDTFSMYKKKINIIIKKKKLFLF